MAVMGRRSYRGTANPRAIGQVSEANSEVSQVFKSAGRQGTWK